MEDQHRFNVKAWLLWTVGFVAFSIAGAPPRARPAGSTMPARP